MKKRFKTSVNIAKTRSFPGADIGSDHELVMMTFKLYLKRAKKSNQCKAAGAVCFNGSTGGWFRTAVGVRQGCLLSPTLFNIFMADALEDHKSTVSIGGRAISNLRFADADSDLELANLVERLHETSTAYGMQISAEKTKLMTSNTNGISSNIGVNGEKLETVQRFNIWEPQSLRKDPCLKYASGLPRP